jgi:hypothetical protein
LFLERERPYSEGDVNAWLPKETWHAGCPNVLHLLDDSAVRDLAEGRDQVLVFPGELFFPVVVILCSFHVPSIAVYLLTFLTIFAPKLAAQEECWLLS